MDKSPSINFPEKEFPSKKLFIWGDQALFLGELRDISLHRHHALQTVIGLARPFKLQVETATVEHRAVILAPNTPHQIDGRGDWQAVLLLSPERETSKRIIASYLKDKDVATLDERLITPIIFELMDAMVLDAPGERVKEVFDNIVVKLSQSMDPGVSIDPRIQNALDIIHDLPTKKISAGDIAKAVYLSEGRLVHLFKEQVGIPIRRYLLWQRLIAAINAFPQTEDLTRAAHDAGFADSAHLSRTFKKMFGLAPSEVFKDSQFVQAIFYLQE